MAILSMECAAAPLAWLYQGQFTKRVTTKMSHSRILSGSNLERAAETVTGLGASQVCVCAMGEEGWLGYVTPACCTEDSYQLKQGAEFMTWYADHGVKSDYLLGQLEWRW
jgi:hypothetical protein